MIINLSTSCYLHQMSTFLIFLQRLNTFRCHILRRGVQASAMLPDHCIVPEHRWGQLFAPSYSDIHRIPRTPSPTASSSHSPSSTPSATPTPTSTVSADPTPSRTPSPSRSQSHSATPLQRVHMPEISVKDSQSITTGNLIWFFVGSCCSAAIIVSWQSFGQINHREVPPTLPGRNNRRDGLPAWYKSLFVVILVLAAIVAFIYILMLWQL